MAGVFYAALLACLVEGPPNPELGDIELHAPNGSAFRIPDLPSDNLVVVAFWGVECPLAKLYVPRLEDLARRFSKRKVSFLVVDSNYHDSAAEVEEYAKGHGLTLPIYLDPDTRLADRLGATRTPEVVLLDQARAVRYRGRLDDQFGPDFRRPRPTRADLERALDEVSSGTPVSVPRTAPLGCLIPRPALPDRSPASAPITWSNRIATVFARHCQACHRPGQVGPFPLTSYSESAPWSATIREVIQADRMPPWGAHPDHGSFANDARLTPADKEAIVAWIDAGAPEGEGKPTAPSPPISFTEGWQLPRPPNRVIPMSDQPFLVPAEGTVEYQYFIVDPGLAEGTWVQGAECRPGNPAVVHHVSVFYWPVEDAGKVPAARLSAGQIGDVWEIQKNLLCTFVPGMRPVVYPAGTSFHLPAGARIVFQVHYVPNGRPQPDCCQLGLLLTDPETVRQPVATLPLLNATFEIPPGDPQYRVEAWHRLPSDSLAHAFFPHMHLRGRSFRYLARYPDGREEILCDIPRYDFLWQMRYLLREPKLLPAGTKLGCVAHFDNSADNPNNPDPTRAVGWGDQSTDEMMIGYVDLSPLAAIPPAAISPAHTHDRPLVHRVATGLTIAAAAGIALVLWGSRRGGHILSANMGEVGQVEEDLG